MVFISLYIKRRSEGEAFICKYPNSAAALIKLFLAKVLRLIDHVRYTSFALGLCVSVC